MLALASAENMVAETPLRLAICCPTAARMQQSATCSTWLMRPDRSASANLWQVVKSLTVSKSLNEGQSPCYQVGRRPQRIRKPAD
jgi:hypothetical protein